MSFCPFKSIWFVIVVVVLVFCFDLFCLLLTQGQLDVLAFTYPYDYLGQGEREDALFDETVLQVSFHLNKNSV